jgi:hypothetical protein
LYGALRKRFQKQAVGSKQNRLTLQQSVTKKNFACHSLLSPIIYAFVQVIFGNFKNKFIEMKMNANKKKRLDK